MLLYGPPGTGKTLLAKAIASNMDANFLKVVSSAIVDKYIGESARLIREMFGYAKASLASLSLMRPTSTTCAMLADARASQICRFSASCLCDRCQHVLTQDSSSFRSGSS